MGLDMFLSGIIYYPAKYDENGKKLEKRKIISILEIDWRKANHIHNWFVNNVQFGQDDCNAYDVSYTQLKKLRDVCEEVIEFPKKAKELLPTKEGFFFGQYEYDEFYFKEIEYTINQINRLLNEEEYDWFEYQSSW